jgi:hypothetical protein
VEELYRLSGRAGQGWVGGGVVVQGPGDPRPQAVADSGTGTAERGLRAAGGGAAGRVPGRLRVGRGRGAEGAGRRPGAQRGALRQRARDRPELQTFLVGLCGCEAGQRKGQGWIAASVFEVYSWRVLHEPSAITKIQEVPRSVA